MQRHREENISRLGPAGLNHLMMMMAMYVSHAIVIFVYSESPLIRSPMGQKNMVVILDDHVNEGFLTRKCMPFLPGSQKKWP